MIHALAFVLSGAAVVIAGVTLARFGDRIAEASGLGRMWIGVVLLCTATSLPELATDVAAVRIDAADLAAGDLFGSSMANMLVLAIVLLLPSRGEMSHRAALELALVACLAVILNALAGALVLARPATTVGGVSAGAVLLLGVYLAGIRAVYRHLRAGVPEATAPGVATGERGLRRPLVGFVAASAVVVAAAPVFAWSAKGLAEITGLGTTFVGTWLVGMATSLPELVSSIAAVRIGASDLALGNLFGSNAFNMVIFVALDVARPGRPIFAAVEPTHAMTALLAVVMTTVGIAAVIGGAERRPAMLRADSILIAVAYVAGLWWLYTQAAVR